MEVRNVNSSIKDINCNKDDIMEALKKLDLLNNERYASLNEITNGYIFSDIFGHVAKFCESEKSWFIYNGVLWMKDNLQIKKIAKIYVEVLDKYIRDNISDKKYISWVENLSKQTIRNKMIDDAKVESVITLNDFDRNDNLFNVKNCTIDLKQGIAREHRAEDYMTKCANVEYIKGAKSKKFESFINDIMSGNKDDVKYLQKLFGQCLSGENREQEAYIFYGKTTRNGKSTLMKVVKEIFGTYCVTTNANTFANQYADANNASPQLCHLKGARIIYVPEPQKAMKLDAAMFKNITGGDEVSARKLYSEQSNFMINGKIIFCTNYLPNFNDKTIFESERIKIMPFNRHYSNDEQDKDLFKKLVTEENKSAILTWMLVGFDDYSNDGLKNTKSVETETSKYRNYSDPIGAFIKDMLVKDDNSNITNATVYNAYKVWYREQDYSKDIESSHEFLNEMRDRNYVSKRGTVDGKSMYNVYIGYRIKTEVDNPPE